MADEYRVPIFNTFLGDVPNGSTSYRRSESVCMHDRLALGDTAFRTHCNTDGTCPQRFLLMFSTFHN
jgi:hypothetical protein